MIDNSVEYSTSDIQKLLQELFPSRRLVLSQFTFYTQCGVAKPTGNTFKRGRRCYRLTDILSIACVLALKEEGIPLKNIGNAPQMIQDSAEKIFELGPSCKLAGCGDEIMLIVPGETSEPNFPLEKLLGDGQPSLFWMYDVGVLARRIEDVASVKEEAARRAA